MEVVPQPRRPGAIILPEELNTYDVLVSDWLVFTKAHARHDRRPPRGRARPAPTTATEVEIARPAPEATDDADDEGADE